MKLDIVDDIDSVDEADGGSSDPPIPRDANEEYRLSQGDRKLNINQLASHFGMKRHAVVEKLRLADITPAEVGRKGAKMFWVSDVQECLTAATVQGKATEKAEAQTRKLEAEAGLKELELDRKRGDTIEVSDVEQGATELFRVMHNRLTAYCDDSALDLSKITTRGAVALYQKERINAILQELRDNPTNFITKYLSE